MKVKIKIYFLLLSICIGLVITPALSAGVNVENETVVLQLTKDTETNLAVNEIVQDHPNALVIQDDNSLKSLLIISSKINSLIVVGHGYEDGILTKSGVISWENHANRINRIDAKKVVALNCDSKSGDEYFEKNVFTFGGEVDARFGGMIASIYTSLFTRHKIDFNQRMNELTNLNEKLISGEIKSMPLTLGPSELNGHIAAIALVLALALLPATSAVSINYFTAGVWFVIGASSMELRQVLGYTLYYAYDTGDMDIWFDAMGQLVIYFSLIVTAVFALAPLYMQVALAAGVSIDTVFTSMATYLKVTFIMGALAVFFYDAINWWRTDDADWDDFYHYTLPPQEDDNPGPPGGYT